MRRSYATSHRQRKVVVKNASIMASIGFFRMMKLFLLGSLFGGCMTLIAIVHFFNFDFSAELEKVKFAIPASKKPEVSHEAKKPAKPVQEDKDVKFEFYNILQGSKSGEDSSNSYIAKNDYFLKIASLQSEEDADMLRQKLEAKNYQVTIKSVVIEDISWWRIYVGPFKTLRETYDIQNHLRYDEIDSILVKGSI